MGTYVYVNTGLGNDLPPGGTAPLPEPSWLRISGILCYSHQSNFTAGGRVTMLYNEFENYT